MVHQFGELIDILSNCASLANVKELSKEKLMLITAEAGMDEGTKGRPVGSGKLVFNGLEPTLGGTREVHCGHTDPHLGLNRVH